MLDRGFPARAPLPLFTRRGIRYWTAGPTGVGSEVGGWRSTGREGISICLASPLARRDDDKASREVVTLLERPQHALIVLDDNFISGFRKPEWCLAFRVADTAVAPQALLEHPQQHGDLAVDVVEDADLPLRRVETV